MTVLFPGVKPQSDAPRCEWCGELLPATQKRGRFHGRKCRQAAHRLRKRGASAGAVATPARFCYADPPYPGCAAKYYAGEPTYGGEVDHAKLIADLIEARYLGWALSTSEEALRYVLSLIPRELPVHVCPWVKPIGVPSTTHGMHNAWEPLLVVGGRQLPPGRRDWLRAQPARFGGELMGRKPLAFCGWMFDMLGMQQGDELVDLFPGTGIVGKAWRERSYGHASLTPRGRVDEEDLVEVNGPTGEALIFGPPRGAGDAEERRAIAVDDAPPPPRGAGDASPAPGRVGRDPGDACAAELDGEPRCEASGKPRDAWCVLCHMRAVDV